MADNMHLTPPGRVGISLNANWYMPEIDSDPSYIEAAETELQFNIGWFAHPILINGNYPDVMRRKVCGKKKVNSARIT